MTSPARVVHHAGMTGNDIRLLHIRRLIARYETAGEFSIAVGIPQETLSRCIGKTPSRPISDDICDRIEAALKLPSGRLSDFFALFDVERQISPSDVAKLTAAQGKLVTTLIHSPPPDEAAVLLTQLVAQFRLGSR
ncbi:hypothetical protein [Deefgea piscis]|uniref:hypothetical protein n=1 Tax=Deefgea piscis TaxID=2739061 RepID=UPI001C801EFA|nr:hypothetical protein [Deefgea piscis]QZA80204.1 hypothetical protein K4H25_11740 [Deefgea piscis]